METEQIAPILDQWMTQPSAEASQAFISEHAAELLTDEAEELLRQQMLEDPNDRDREMLLALLVMARRDGVEAAYQSIRAEMEENARVRGEILFSKFVQVGDAAQLAQLLDQLTPQDMDLLEQTAVQRLEENDEEMAQGIQQRLEAMRQMRQGTAQLSPIEQMVLAYLRAASDEEAQAMLEQQAGVLLTREAAAALEGFNARDPRAQAQLDKRRWMWAKAMRALMGEDVADETPAPDGSVPDAEVEVDGTMALDIAINTFLGEAPDEESFDELVERMPVMTELETLARLAERVELAQATGRNDVATGTLSLLLALLDPFYARHESVTDDEKATLDGLWERLIPVAEALEQPAIVEALRQELSDAANG